MLEGSERWIALAGVVVAAVALFVFLRRRPLRDAGVRKEWVVFILFAFATILCFLLYWAHRASAIDEAEVDAFLYRIDTILDVQLATTLAALSLAAATFSYSARLKNWREIKEKQAAVARARQRAQRAREEDSPLAAGYAEEEQALKDELRHLALGESKVAITRCYIDAFIYFVMCVCLVFVLDTVVAAGKHMEMSTAYATLVEAIVGGGLLYCGFHRLVVGALKAEGVLTAMVAELTSVPEPEE